MEKIIEVLGRPSESEIKSMESTFAKSLFENCNVEGEPKGGGAAAGTAEGGEAAEGASADAAADTTGNSGGTPPPLKEEERKVRWHDRFAPKVADETVRDDVIDLLYRLMCFSKKERLDAQQGLEHPYCAQFRDPETEAVAKSRVLIPLSDNDKRKKEEYLEKCLEFAQK